ncbi:hypothetical protein PG989_011796 [Apiospora arundinis]
MTTENNTKILAVKWVSELDGYIVRAKINGLIRYLSVTSQAAARFPRGWDKTGKSEDFLVLPEEIPADLKCIHLRRQGSSNIPEPLCSSDFPIQIPLVNVELKDVEHPAGLMKFDYDDLTQDEKVSSARFEHRICEDRLRVVRPRSSQENASRLLMKLVEFPDTWPNQFASGLRPVDTPPSPAHIALVSPESKNNSKVSSKARYGKRGTLFTAEQYMAHEIEMHRQVDAALREATGAQPIVPQFHGLVTEKGRGVVGFLSEFLEGASSYFDLFRAATAQQVTDWKVPEAEREKCQAALRALHAAGFIHGDVHAGNFIRCPDGSVRIIDFEDAERIDPQSEEGIISAQIEMNLLEGWLREKSSKYSLAFRPSNTWS